MKYWPLFLCLSLTLLPVNAAGTKKAGLTVPVKYEGGTLPLTQGRSKATISGDAVLFSHGNQKVAIPLKNITTISCSTDVHRRFGASVLGVVPKMHLDTEAQHYIGLSWADGDQASKIEAVLKLSNGEYREFLSALERLTGRKAVNTHNIPTIVKYGL
jgi:hypothetical protein